ncbi:hypothetical protein HYH02_004790 [Chlamydomonas schloesseri]|uniref:Uncharacterized protein n=1 Tax=Chlamydomonas schloesseri TaxID=2026947 RepID=A0A835WMP7_9CHLO|nr:hypothetical protein HYH02_004790 [Chlamydomonas schloesseri]|eukprot:KAG2450281.1 hypothetical protein HYH02_004790 [Chlamydomonas schloesseri]
MAAAELTQCGDVVEDVEDKAPGQPCSRRDAFCPQGLTCASGAARKLEVLLRVALPFNAACRESPRALVAAARRVALARIRAGALELCARAFARGPTAFSSWPPWGRLLSACGTLMASLYFTATTAEQVTRSAPAAGAAAAAAAADVAGLGPAMQFLQAAHVVAQVAAAEGAHEAHEAAALRRRHLRAADPAASSAPSSSSSSSSSGGGSLAAAGMEAAAVQQQLPLPLLRKEGG